MILRNIKWHGLALCSLFGVLMLRWFPRPDLVGATPCNPAQGDSPWSLDPFLGSYEMDMSQAINMVNFTHGRVGVPLSVTLGFERQIFTKTPDGQNYQQYVLRNESQYDAVSTFVLGVQSTIIIPGTTQTLTYRFTMLNADTLQGNYSWNFGDRIENFVIMFAFYPDFSGFFDTVHSLTCPSFISTAPFFRISNIIL